MISPGCSFHFDGLKQTLLAVRSGIEKQLTTVTQLLVNYRTTKDVLLLANAVLRRAQRAFPKNIPFARQEIARIDHGLRVILCDRDCALREKVQLGTNQALVYSSPYEIPESPMIGVTGSSSASTTTNDRFSWVELRRIVQEWLDTHPFIMSALESKGLEFEDVIVLFQYERKDWEVDRKLVASLRMLRELYVAITRAKRRVVILYSRECPEMLNFLRSLGCEFEEDGAALVLQQFQSVTTAEEWEKQGRELFENENYVMAARCFNLAKKTGWYHWALGKHSDARGLFSVAGSSLLAAFESFATAKEYALVLEVCLALENRPIANHVQWTNAHSALLTAALDNERSSQPRSRIVRLALSKGMWDEITLHDLKDDTLAAIFVPHRGNPKLSALIASSLVNISDRSILERVIPSIVADVHLDQKNYCDAIRLYLLCREQDKAVKATKGAISEFKKKTSKPDLSTIPSLWDDQREGVVNDPEITTLFQLLHSVKRAAHTIPKECLQYLGKDIIIYAANLDQDMDLSLLHRFSSDHFFSEINEYLLESKFTGNRMDVFRWYIQEGDTRSALEFARMYIAKWHDSELLEMNDCFFPCLEPLLTHELKRRHLLFPLVIYKLADKSLVGGDCEQKLLDSLISSQTWKFPQNSDRGEKHCFVLKSVVEKLTPRKGGKVNNNIKYEEDIAMQATRAVMDVWPKKESSVKLKSLPERDDKFQFTRHLCEELLESIFAVVTDAQTRCLILEKCFEMKHNTASILLTRLCWENDQTMLALEITYQALSETKSTDDVKESLLSFWIEMERLNPKVLLVNGDPELVCRVTTSLYAYASDWRSAEVQFQVSMVIVKLRSLLSTSSFSRFNFSLLPRCCNSNMVRCALSCDMLNVAMAITEMALYEGDLQQIRTIWNVWTLENDLVPCVDADSSLLFRIGPVLFQEQVPLEVPPFMVYGCRTASFLQELSNFSQGFHLSCSRHISLPSLVTRNAVAICNELVERVPKYVGNYDNSAKAKTKSGKIMGQGIPKLEPRSKNTSMARSCEIRHGSMLESVHGDKEARKYRQTANDAAGSGASASKSLEQQAVVDLSSINNHDATNRAGGAGGTAGSKARNNNKKKKKRGKR